MPRRAGLAASRTGAAEVVAHGTGSAGLPPRRARYFHTAAIGESITATAARTRGRSVERRRVDCLKCKDLENKFDISLNDYMEARSSAYYRVSTELAARKNVDMERARYDLEEHHLVCACYPPGGLSAFPFNKAPRPLIGWNGVSFPLKALLLAVFSLCFPPSVVVALSQDAPNQAPKTRADTGARLTTIMGTVHEDGEKIEVRNRTKSLEGGQPGDS